MRENHIFVLGLDNDFLLTVLDYVAIEFVGLFVPFIHI